MMRSRIYAVLCVMYCCIVVNAAPDTVPVTVHTTSRHSRVLGGNLDNTPQADATATFSQANHTALALDPRRVRGGDGSERERLPVPDIATLAYRDDLSDTERSHWHKHYQDQREELANNAAASLRGTQHIEHDSQWHTLRVAWGESVMRVITLSVGSTLTAYPNASQSNVDFLIRELKTDRSDVSVLFAAAPQQIRLDVATAERWRGIPLDGGDATLTFVRIDNTQRELTRELTVVARIAYAGSDGIARGFDSHAMSWMAAPWMTAELHAAESRILPRLFRCVLVAPATLEVTAIFTKPSLSPDMPLALSVVFPSVLRRFVTELYYADASQ